LRLSAQERREGLDGDAIDARRSVIAAHLLPRRIGYDPGT
jgi:hypothetical protein